MFIQDTTLNLRAFDQPKWKNGLRPGTFRTGMHFNLTQWTFELLSYKGLHLPCKK